MNKLKKKAAKQRGSAPAKPTKAGKVQPRETKRSPEPAPILTPEERSAETPVNWFDVLHAKQREKDSAVLKQEDMPVYQVRFIIRTIFQRISDRAPFICEAMLADLVKAKIIQPGPQWDSSLAPSMMAKHIRKSPKAIEDEIDGLITFGHGVFGERRGPDKDPDYVVYRYYRHLRLERDLVLRAPKPAEARKLWADVWRMARQESCVNEQLEKSPMEVKDFKAVARERARRAFLDEIRPLKSSRKARKGR